MIPGRCHLERAEPVRYAELRFAAIAAGPDSGEDETSQPATASDRALEQKGQ